MKTIMPDGKGGVMSVEAAMPELFAGAALCRMTHSLISAGTERGIIENCIGKSAEEIIQNNTRLGYLGAGIVEEIMGERLPCKKGERVAYYGAPFVSHGEYVVVPERLLFALPENVSQECGAFIGLGAIAMHGFRLGKAGLGEVCHVAGAGIIGNLCAQFALCAGCRVILTDYDSGRLEIFKGCVPAGDYVCAAPDVVEGAVHRMSGGQGADAVFLCMGTTSSEPMAQAMRLVRAGGRIVIVGVLDIKVPREDFFAKEVEVTISRAAGPGRYDGTYEREGRDYPVQYVRWTEGRNLGESLRLIAAGRIHVEPMISHVYPVNRFAEAYEGVIQNRPGMGYILDWK
ncbi:MAG: zinc-binding alcohol dehydrogenase [Candidatus Sumerlaeota bacterium]|nr:zinc-binding alcohol dehydrogenase [Candidatus Sumerlaeota bacterium]